MYRPSFPAALFLLIPSLFYLLGCQQEKTAASDMFSIKTIAPHHPMIRYRGRVNFDNPDSPKFSWTASGIECSFTGPFIAVTLAHWPGSKVSAYNEQADYYNVYLDGKLSDTLSILASTERFVLGQDLTDTTHHLKIIKRTEGRVGIGSLLKLEIMEGRTLVPAPTPSQRRIEFIGNSITCGYGNLGNSAACSFSPSTEDGTRTYASMTADSLGADMRVIAWSGCGVYRNYDDRPGAKLPELFLQTLPTDQEATHDFSLWQPQLVVINLGTNDFATGIPPEQAFKAAYKGLISSIHQHYPEAKVLCLTGPMLDDRRPKRRLSTLQRWLDDIQASFQSSDLSVYRFDLTRQGPLGFGCNYHPNLAQHELNGKELTDFIRAQIWPTS